MIVRSEFYNFGSEAAASIRRVIMIREQLRPYIAEQFKLIASDGIPITRPLSFDFPLDAQAGKDCDLTEDCASQSQMMFGPALMVAPQLHLGAGEREVYLPRLEAGEEWQYWFTNQSLGQGGNTITQPTPLAGGEFPLFRRVAGNDPAPPPPTPAPSPISYVDIGNGFCVDAGGKRPQTFLCDDSGGNAKCPSTQSDCAALCTADDACTGFMLQDMSMHPLRKHFSSSCHLFDSQTYLPEQVQEADDLPDCEPAQAEHSGRGLDHPAGRSRVRDCEARR